MDLNPGVATASCVTLDKLFHVPHCITLDNNNTSIIEWLKE